MDQYYYYDGQQVVGMHSLTELQELFAQGTINDQTPVIQMGQKDWSALAAFCDLNSPECQPLSLDLDYYQPGRNYYVAPVEEHSETEAAKTDAATENTETDTVPEDLQAQMPAIQATEDEKESLREDEEELKQQRPKRHQLLRQVRAELDLLWECQRESIIARIKYEQLDKTFEATRKRNREIFRAIEENAVEYWRRSGLLVYWIAELTWREHDFTHRLRGKTETEKYESLRSWLEETRLGDFAGCYCFKNGREYIYIGQAGILKDRIKQHEKKTYFTYATSCRIVIPKNKRQMNQLERLLILAHQPTDNGNTGIIGRNPADDCLEFIKGEIKELVTDF